MASLTKLYYSNTSILLYLDNKCAKNNGAEDQVVEDAIKHIPLAMDLASVELIEELHHDKGIEDDCVVF